MKLKAGDVLVNSVGKRVVVKKVCLNCQYLNPNARGRYKCHTPNCPAYTKPVKKEKTYFVVCMLSEDAWPEILYLSGQSAKEVADKIGQDSMAIFEGDLVKNFDTKIDLTKL